MPPCRKAYGGKRAIKWMEIYSGEKSLEVYGEDQWLPEETLTAMKEFVVGIKGPMTTPGRRRHPFAERGAATGARSLRLPAPDTMVHRAYRVQWSHPEKTDMVIFRENTEDIYAGVEWEADSPGATKVLEFLRTKMSVTKIRFPEHCGIGIKPVSEEGSKRLIRRAIQYAIDEDRPSVTLVHKGNIMKFTEGAFKEWGYELAREEFGATPLDGGPWHQMKGRRPARAS